MIDFATIEQASRAALIEAYNCGEQRQECGGVIYQHADGRYSFTPPITDHKAFGVSVPYLYSIPPPAGEKVVADYHNHICSIHNKPFAEFFSYADASVNAGFHIIGYMLDGCTGNIHRYDPASDDRDDEEVDLVSGKKFFLTIGHISGWIDIFV